TQEPEIVSCASCQRSSWTRIPCERLRTGPSRHVYAVRTRCRSSYHRHAHRSCRINAKERRTPYPCLPTHQDCIFEEWVALGLSAHLQPLQNLTRSSRLGPSARLAPTSRWSRGS